MPDIILTDGPDTRTLSPGELGTDGSLFALRENDDVTGSTSNEKMFLGRNNDVGIGEGGNDAILGDRGSDIVVGGDGNDLLRGGKDDDALIGGNGNDLILGDRGVDALAGNAGADTFVIFDDSDLAGTSGDQIIDYSVAGGDRIELIDLTPDDITLNSVITMTAGILANLPGNFDIDAATNLGAVSDIDFRPQGMLQGWEIIANGQILAIVYGNNTEDEVRSSISTTTFDQINSTITAFEQANSLPLTFDV